MSDPTGKGSKGRGGAGGQGRDPDKVTGQGTGAAKQQEKKNPTGEVFETGAELEARLAGITDTAEILRMKRADTNPHSNRLYDARLDALGYVEPVDAGDGTTDTGGGTFPSDQGGTTGGPTT